MLDTNVVSELRRVRPHGGVLAWLRMQPEHLLHICAFTLAELQAGAEAIRQNDPQRAAALENWIDTIPALYNVLSMDAAAFRSWARLKHRRPAGLHGDAMIAATAACHGMTVVTRNVADFVVLGAKVLDPFAYKD